MRALGVCLLAVSALATLAGCSIKQEVKPADMSPTLAPEICIIPAKGVREGFTSAYSSALQEKGFTVRQLPWNSFPDRCPLSTTYTGSWRWDVALYMRYAEIRVYQSGREVGKAIYDARGGGGRPDKWIDAEKKIRELAAELFPNGASQLGQYRPAPTSPEQAAKLSKQQQLDALQNEGLGYEEYMRRVREINAQ